MWRSTNTSGDAGTAAAAAAVGQHILDVLAQLREEAADAAALYEGKLLVGQRLGRPVQFGGSFHGVSLQFVARSIIAPSE